MIFRFADGLQLLLRCCDDFKNLFKRVKLTLQQVDGVGHRVQRSGRKGGEARLYRGLKNGLPLVFRPSSGLLLPEDLRRIRFHIVLQTYE